MMSVEIEPGEHTVEFKYLSDSFVYGCVITAVGVAGFVAAIFVERYLDKRRKTKWIEQNKMSS